MGESEGWERGRGVTNGREGLGKGKGEGRKENRWGGERGGRNVREGERDEGQGC